MTGINYVDPEPVCSRRLDQLQHQRVGVSNLCERRLLYRHHHLPRHPHRHFGDFVQYSTSVQVLVFGAVLNLPDSVYDFNSGTVTWMPVSPGSADGTLTLGQVLVMPDDATESPADNDQTSDASLTFTGPAGTCTPNPPSSTVICAKHHWFLSYPHLEKFYLTLTISGNGASISGRGGRGGGRYASRYL